MLFFIVSFCARLFKTLLWGNFLLTVDFLSIWGILTRHVCSPVFAFCSPLELAKNCLILLSYENFKITLRAFHLVKYSRDEMIVMNPLVDTLVLTITTLYLVCIYTRNRKTCCCSFVSYVVWNCLEIDENLQLLFLLAT